MKELLIISAAVAIIASSLVASSTKTYAELPKTLADIPPSAWPTQPVPETEWPYIHDYYEWPHWLPERVRPYSVLTPFLGLPDHGPEVPYS
jgi:hypothetical protein